jgi:hypothetical protein
MARKAKSKRPPKSRGDYDLSRLEAAFSKSKMMRRASIQALMSSWRTQVREYDEARNSNQPNRQSEGTLAGQSAETTVADLFDFNNVRMRGMWAAAALRLDPDNPAHKGMLQAFEAAGLEPKNPFDWFELVRLYSDAFLGERGAGRHEEWPATRHEELRLDFEHIKRNHRDVDDDKEICRILLRTEPYKTKYKSINSAEYLVKLLRAARKPEINYHLKHPEMPLAERVLREHAERRGYDWSEWGSTLTNVWKASVSEMIEPYAEGAVELLMRAGPNQAHNLAGIDLRVQLILDYSKEHGVPVTRERAIKTLSLIDKEWSKFKKG